MGSEYDPEVNGLRTRDLGSRGENSGDVGVVLMSRAGFLDLMDT